MATRTSTQSGNFNSTSTWGGSSVPVGGDSFYISQGHTVTITDGQGTSGSSGFDNSFVYGKLEINNGGTLRMNGLLRVSHGSTSPTQHYVEGTAASGPFFRMNPGSICEFNAGSNSDHGLYLDAHQWLTCEMEGTQKMRRTTLSANKVIGNTTLDVTSNTGFAVGDWCSVYRSTAPSGQNSYVYVRSDEGFIIHDISGSTIYFKHFISPTATITGVQGSAVIVDNAKVFRKSDKVIFGTGSNRNVKEITGIDYLTNTLTFPSSINGTVNGLTVYKTGLEKSHLSGDYFQKIATCLTADTSTSGQNYIDVASTDGFAVGDDIGLPCASLTYIDTWNFQQNYTIQSISGNRITLTENLATDTSPANNGTALYWPSGNWVCNFTRDTKFRGVDGNQYAFMHSNYSSSSSMYNRRLLLKDVQFYHLGGDTNDNYRGMKLRGRFAYSNSNYHSRMENCSVRLNGGTNAEGSSSNHRMYWDNHVADSVRNCYFTSHYYGPMMQSCYHVGFFNSISYKSNYSTVYCNGMYNNRSEYSYIHASRGDDYTVFFYHARNGSFRLRHWEILGSDARPIYFYYQNGAILLDTIRVDGFKVWPYIGSGGGNPKFYNSTFKNQWDITGDSLHLGDSVDLNQDGNGSAQYGGGNRNMAASICHNFEFDAVAQWGGSHLLREWDHDEQAWKVTVDRDSGYTWVGFHNQVFLPAETKLMVKGQVKRRSTSTNEPGLYIWSQHDGDDRGRYLDYQGSDAIHDDPITTTGGSDRFSRVSGFGKDTVFPDWTGGDWVTQTLELGPLKHDVIVTVAIGHATSEVTDPGWYEKPLEIYVDKPYPFPISALSDQMTALQFPQVKDSVDQTITRLGGIRI